MSAVVAEHRRELVADQRRELARVVEFPGDGLDALPGHVGVSNARVDVGAKHGVGRLRPSLGSCDQRSKDIVAPSLRTHDLTCIRIILGAVLVSARGDGIESFRVVGNGGEIERRRKLGDHAVTDFHCLAANEAVRVARPDAVPVAVSVRRPTRMHVQIAEIDVSGHIGVSGCLQRCGTVPGRRRRVVLDGFFRAGG